MIDCGPNVFVIAGMELHRVRAVGRGSASTACGELLRGAGVELHTHAEGLPRVLRLLAPRETAPTVCATCCPEHAR